MWRELSMSMRLAWHMVVHRDRKRVRAIARRLQSVRHQPNTLPTRAEQKMLEAIHAETARLNRNNVTRTAAYFAFFQKHPEIHWAVLAHMVSRNGGWSMTDLRGDWFPRMSGDKDAERFFAFLERANWLIFRDAYPQLMLYERAQQSGRPCTHLLQHLGVSRFMQAIWDDFAATKDSQLLTNALIVNEQNFIESRVVQNPQYSQAVLDSMQYKVQSVLSLNHVLIPYRTGSEVRLDGTVVKHFGSLDERIATGKRLYGMLYRDRMQHARVREWIERVPHTGSRSDFWPDLFTANGRAMLDGAYQPKLLSGRKPGRRIFSPRLEDVWPDVRHREAEPGDWFRDATCLVHLFEPVSQPGKDFTDTYVEGLRTIERILVAQDKIAAFVPGSPGTNADGS